MPDKSKNRAPDEPPTMASLARELNLSSMTVSRVLSGADAKVSARTRELVIREARKRKMEVNYLARSFSSKRAGVIGLVTPFEGLLGSEYFARIVQGIESVATEQDLGIALFNTRAKTADCGNLLDRYFRQRRVDGFLVIAPTSEDVFLETLVKADAPAVLVGAYAESESLVSVDVDARPGLTTALNTLVGLGHKRIGFLRGPVNVNTSNRRWIIFNELMKDAGLEVFSGWCPVANFSRLEAHHAVAGMLRSKNRPSALLAANDLMALGAMNAATQAGLSIPRDMSVIGFDAISDSEESIPALSTVEQPMEEIGKTAAKHLIQLIQGKRDTGSPSHTDMPSRFLARKTHTNPCNQ